MLALAEQKRNERKNLLYLRQDMSDFSLHKAADVVLCICDSINYLLDEVKLRNMFACVRNVLTEDGIFLFDMKTEYCFQEILAGNVRVEDGESYTVIWDNEYDPQTKMDEYLLTMFMERPDGLYERYDECHCQRAYSTERIKELLEDEGFELKDCFGSDMTTSPNSEDERIYVVASWKGEQKG
jgi:hypothetical protein